MRPALVSLTLVSLLASAPAGAFCGFYVSGAAEELHNPATSVVLMRDGTRTVIAMQNHYEGPPQDFAMVVPVPVVLSRDDVRTLPSEVFDRIDHLDSPRLVEYWEQDPCGSGGIGDGFGIGLGAIGTIGHGGGGGSGSLGVHVEARFSVGEYDVVVLSATDSSGLDTWLRNEHYNIPSGAAPYLDPYVRAGMKFFVARVDVHRVTFENGRAKLSPLRFHYDTDAFSLPIRLGLINSPGAQDLVVHILAHDQRYEVANRENVTVPTNLDVDPSVRATFGGFYASLFDRVLEQHPRAVVTEYAWQSSSCDPCPVPGLTDSELMTLGADVLPSTQAAVQLTTTQTQVALRIETPTVTGPIAASEAQNVAERNQAPLIHCLAGGEALHAGQITLRMTVLANGTVSLPEGMAAPEGMQPAAQCMVSTMSRWRFAPHAAGASNVFLPITIASETLLRGPGVATLQEILRSMVLTRLHTRYGRDAAGDDLVFRAAPAITGGREVRDQNQQLEHGAVVTMGNASTFQARYAIRHPWTGAVACEHPRRGVWGGPPSGSQAVSPTSAPPTAFATRLATPLSSMVMTPVPDLLLGAAGAPGTSPRTIGVRPARAHRSSGSVFYQRVLLAAASVLVTIVAFSQLRRSRRRG